MKNQKSFKIKKPIKEGSMSNFESIAQFKEQVERYILKHKDNPNAVINDLASGLFFAFSEAFSKDGRPETNGLNMLEKMINKLRVLMKTHENLIPPEQEEFDFEDSNLDSEEMDMEEDDNEVQNMVDDLNDNTSMDEEEDEELNGIYESKRGSGMKRYNSLKEGSSGSSPFAGMNKNGVPKFTMKDWKKLKQLKDEKKDKSFNDLFLKFFPNAAWDLKVSSKEELVNWSRPLVKD